MSISKYSKMLVPAVVSVLLLTASACKSQRVHPGQRSAFDGAAYDSLTLAHGALIGLRLPVENHYASLKPAFNEAVRAFDIAASAYGDYHTGKVEELSAASSALNRLTLALTLLEGELASGLEAASAAPANTQPHFSLKAGPAELLTALQWAATLAAVVERTGHATDAQILAVETILNATRQAFNDWNQVTDQPIDLARLAAIATV